MSAKKLLTLLLAALLVLSLAACGKKGNDDMTKPDGEPKNARPTKFSRRRAWALRATTCV